MTATPTPHPGIVLATDRTARCDRALETATRLARASALEPAAVTVVTLKSEPVTLTRELAGRAEASQQAEVRPQVGGIVERLLFTEGGSVRAGQPLYQLDQTAYRADAGSAQAAVARAQTALTNARQKAERTAELFLSLEGQHSLVVVEHDMKFVDQLTEGRKKVTVLHEGSVLAEGRLSEVQANEKVVEVYLGR